MAIQTGLVSYLNEIQADKQRPLYRYVTNIFNNSEMSDEDIVSFLIGLLHVYSLIKRALEIEELEDIMGGSYLDVSGKEIRAA